MKREEIEKIKWIVVFCGIFLLFLYGFFIQNIIINLLVIFFVLVIYKYGNYVLFREYDEKRKQKIEELMKIKEVIKEILREKSFIKR